MNKIIILVVGILVGMYLGIVIERVKPIKASPKSKPVVETQYRIVYRIKGTSISVDKDVIIIGDDGESSRPSLSISNKEYPSLFFTTKDVMADQISVEGVTDIKNKNEYAVLTRERFSAGSFTPGYFIIVNMNTRKVIYESPQSFVATRTSQRLFSSDGSEVAMSWSPFYFNSSVTNLMLPMLEYAAYDSKIDKFILSNNIHIDSFKKLAKTYDDAANNCYFYRKLMDVTTLIRDFGGDAKCDDYLDPKKPTFNSEGFLSVGQFESVSDALSKIISGDNIQLAVEKFEAFSGQKGRIEENYSSAQDQEIAFTYSKRETLFSKYPELIDYVNNHYVFLVDMMEYKTDSDPVIIFQSFPVGCGSCGTRSVDYLYKGVVRELDSGHEIHHEIINNANGTSTLRIKYALLNGEGNSDYKWSLVEEFKWDKDKNDFILLSESKIPSPYSK